MSHALLSCALEGERGTGGGVSGGPARRGNSAAANGRIGRLLISLMLCSTDRLAKPLVYLSSHFDRYRDAYMNLMLAVSQKGAWTAWINFFLEAVIACAIECRGQAQGLLTLRLTYLKRFRSARSSALLQKLIERLFEKPVIGINEAATLLDVTPAAASSNLKKLAEAKIIHEVTGRKRNQLFIATEIISFMNDVQAGPSRGRSSGWRYSDCGSTSQRETGELTSPGQGS
jgi:hypothetical protein